MFSSTLFMSQATSNMGPRHKLLSDPRKQHWVVFHGCTCLDILVCACPRIKRFKNGILTVFLAKHMCTLDLLQISSLSGISFVVNLTTNMSAKFCFRAWLLLGLLSAGPPSSQSLVFCAPERHLQPVPQPGLAPEESVFSACWQTKHLCSDWEIPKAWPQEWANRIAWHLHARDRCCCLV